MDLRYKLPAGYSIREIETEEFGKLWPKHAKRFFEESSLMYDAASVLSEKEKKQLRILRENFKPSNQVRLNLGIFHKNKFIGWSWGFQETAIVFYM